MGHHAEGGSDRTDGYHSGVGRYSVEAPRPPTRSLLLERFGSGYPKATVRPRIHLHRFQWKAPQEPQDVGTDKEALHPARLDRCVDLPRVQRPRSSNRTRCQRAEAIPVPPFISKTARRNEVSPDAGVQPDSPQAAPRVERDLSLQGLPRDKVLATVVRLLEKTLIRVGNQVYAKKNRSFGLTTMRDRHVEVAGAEIRFKFRGKSGVVHSVAINDRRLARIVQQCQSLPGQELFQFVDDSGKRQDITSNDVNDYLHRITGHAITAKDFRTWAGTMRAAIAFRNSGPPRQGPKADRDVVRVVDEVAEHLGNTRDVCRKYYIHPRVIERYLKGEVISDTPPLKSPKRRRKSADLRRDEHAVLKFLALEDKKH